MLLCAARVQAADRYAVVITGASGGPVYAEKYDKWRTSFLLTLTQKLNYPDDHLFVLAETESRTAGRATRENVRRIFSGLRGRLTGDDLLLVILIGHGTTAEGDEAKFNLVGPDLSASQWAEVLKPIPAKIVVVNTTGGSFPFMKRLSGPGRIVLTATDSAAQQFETVFPEFFVKAFDDPEADADKNGRVSIWEAFSYASAGVRRWFEQHGHLPTERPLLDDTGAGIGREAQNPGTDGAARARDLSGAGRRRHAAGRRRASRSRPPADRARAAARRVEGAEGIDAGRSVRPRARADPRRARARGLKTEQLRTKS